MQVRSLTFGIGFNTNMSPLISADRKVDGFKSNVKKLGFTIDKTDSSTKKFGKNSSNAVTNKTINQVGKFNNELKKTDGITNGLGNSFGRLKTIVLGFLGLKIAKDSLMGGSDLSETRSKFQTVFGETSADAEKWVNEMSDTWGRSRVDLMTNMASSQDLLTGFGMGTKQATEFSKIMTEIPTHIASFGNISDKDATENFRKGILGSHEALEMLGIKLRDDSLNEKALNMGYSGKFSTLSEIEKIKIRLALATEQSKNALRKENGAIGDAAITSKGFANQLKRLWGNVKDISSGFGMYFTPALGEAMIPLNQFLSKIRDDIPKLKPYVERFITGFKNLKDEMIKLKPYFNATINFIKGMKPATWKLGLTVIILANTFFKLEKAYRSFLNTFGMVKEGTKMVQKGFLFASKTALVPLIQVAAVITLLVLVVNDLWVGLKGGNSVLVPFINKFLKFIGINKDFKQVVVGTIKVIKSLFSAFKNIVADVFQGIKTIIQSNLFQGYLEGVKQAWIGAFQFLGGVVKTFFGFFKGLFTGNWDLFLSGAKTLLKGFGNMIVGAIKILGSFLGYGINVFVGFVKIIGKIFWGLGKIIVKAIVSPFISVFSWMEDKVGWIFKRLAKGKDELKGFGDKNNKNYNFRINDDKNPDDPDIPKSKNPYDLDVIKHKSPYEKITEEKNESTINNISTQETNSKNESKVKVIKYADKIEINVHDSKDPIATAKAARKELQDMIDEHTIQVEEE